MASRCSRAIFSTAVTLGAMAGGNTVIRSVRSQRRLKRRDYAEALGQKEERLSERMILGGSTDVRPIQLLADGAYHEQGLLEIAVVLTERQQLGDHDRRRRQHWNPDAQNLVLLRRLQQRVRDWNAREPMQHIDQSRLLHGIDGVVVKVGLEEPVFRRPLNP